MAYKNRAQQMQSVGIPLEYPGQDEDMKALAKQMKISLGRLMWQTLLAYYKTELTELYRARQSEAVDERK